MSTTVLPVLRRSAMQAAKACLFRYHQIWDLGTPDQSDLALKGIGFHACAHKYIERLVNAELQQDEEEARRAFTEGIAVALTPAHLIPEVREIYMRWAEFFGLDLEHFLAAEEHQIGNNQQTFTPDLVYARPTGIEVVDFKTFWHGLTEDQIRNDWQARWYVFNAMRIWPNFPSYTFTHSYVRFGKQVSVTFDPSELATFADEVEAVAATITAAAGRDEWPATPGTECAYCQLRCPIADHPAVIQKRFTVPEQAALVGGSILAVETWLKAAKKTLKEYCAANGAVEINGMEFDNRPVLQRSYPIADVLTVLKNRNVMGAFDGEQGLTISHSALAKLFKGFPMLEQDLLPFQSSRTSYRFSAKKPGLSDDEDE